MALSGSFARCDPQKASFIHLSSTLSSSSRENSSPNHLRDFSINPVPGYPSAREHHSPAMGCMHSNEPAARAAGNKNNTNCRNCIDCENCNACVGAHALILRPPFDCHIASLDPERFPPTSFPLSPRLRLLHLPLFCLPWPSPSHPNDARK